MIEIYSNYIKGGFVVWKWKTITGNETDLEN